MLRSAFATAEVYLFDGAAYSRSEFIQSALDPFSHPLQFTPHVGRALRQFDKCLRIASTSAVAAVVSACVAMVSAPMLGRALWPGLTSKP